MKCLSVLTRVDALRTDELPAAERAEVESHIEKCRSCNASLSDVDEFAGVARMLRPSRLRAAAIVSACADRLDSFDIDGQIVWVGHGPRGIRMIDVRSATADEFRAKYARRFGRPLCDEPLPRREREALEAALRGVRGNGGEVDLSELTDFEREVLTIIRRIPRGEVRTYEWVAREAGRPKAVRAVGNIMARNPVPFLLPCHRVVPAAGGIGNYAFGTPMKRAILEREGAPVHRIEELARKGVRYIGSKTTKIFCFPTCRDARRIREENEVAFHDAAEAKEHGYRPCQHCHPVAA